MAKKQEKKKPNYTKSAAYIGSGTLIGVKGVRSGVPRLAGVRLEQHTTSTKNYKDIKKSGNWLDPAFGGSDRGAGHGLGGTQGEIYKQRSRGYVHLTRSGSGNPVKDYAAREVQGAMYGVMQRRRGEKPKRLYIPGTDEYFDKMEIDPDSGEEAKIASRTKEKVKAFGNRFSATAHTVRKEGLINLIKKNPKRSLSGAAILGTGLSVGGYLVKKGIDESGLINVKSYTRNGKTVKASKRKRSKK